MGPSKSPSPGKANKSLGVALSGFRPLPGRRHLNFLKELFSKPAGSRLGPRGAEGIGFCGVLGPQCSRIPSVLGHPWPTAKQHHPGGRAGVPGSRDGNRRALSTPYPGLLSLPTEGPLAYLWDTQGRGQESLGTKGVAYYSRGHPSLEDSMELFNSFLRSYIHMVKNSRYKKVPPSHHFPQPPSQGYQYLEIF